MARPRRAPDETRREVARLHRDGLPHAEIARRLGVSKATVSYHARRLGLEAGGRSAVRYDWTEVQAFYDAGNSIARCRERFGMARCTIAAAAKRGDLVTRPHAIPIDELLADRRRNRTHVKTRLRRAGLVPDACERCGIAEWMGEPVVLQLHHRNGDGRDHRLENLQFLCPNCHSQTENWGGRNRKRSPIRAARSDAA